MNSPIDAQVDGHVEALNSFHVDKTLISVQVNFSLYFN
jgi:hypothetical protein